MQVHLLATFAAAALAHFLALLSPGPDFFLVVRSAVRHDRRLALGVAFGIATANGVYIALCLLGVGALLAASATVMLLIKLAGGLFLAYLAYGALRARKRDYQSLTESADGVHRQTTFRREFSVGFLSGILNPKNPLFYLSLFTLVLNQEAGMGFKIWLGIWMVSIVFFWDAFIIVVLSRADMQQRFRRCAFYIDKITGMLLGTFGLTLLYSCLMESRF
ncbi:LysE family translocator [Gynuella sunshinyii]|uniref:Putative threonine efflux protein n=1 Tax=Gynuella sunshinyii YC6258 TaxID=1445510 RepID=A0A0C5VSM1_9GAMM|nr:LysE family transporter [Gynuella sunshinyii]AJQ93264.1 putative threonine efflux protein [Gynuella sunshinyii YC6258]